MTRLVKGSPLLFDPKPRRSAISRAIATRFMSPHPPRFVGLLAPPAPDGRARKNHLLETSAGMRLAETQQRSLDRWRSSVAE